MYSVVKASSAGGSATIVSSNGITILPVDVPLDGFVVNDGARCTNDGQFCYTSNSIGNKLLLLGHLCCLISLLKCFVFCSMLEMKCAL